MESTMCETQGGSTTASPSPGEVVVDAMANPSCCPYCHSVYQSPVVLPCGHSVCQPCCSMLLAKSFRSSQAHNHSRRTVRMGVRSVILERKQRKFNKTSSSVLDIDETIKYRSPECPVCFARPQFQPPVRNYALESLLRQLRKQATSDALSAITRLPSPAPSSSSSSGFDEIEEITPTRHTVNRSIQKCNIAVLGAPGVGKSRLIRAQHLNNLFFGEMSSNTMNKENDCQTSVSEREAKYMIELIDASEMSADSTCEIDGIALAFSCADRESFINAFKIYEDMKNPPPIVLVATKCDIDQRKRAIFTEEAAKLAMFMNCPYMEVSAKKNIGVNEVFTELVHQFDKRNERRNITQL
uniref:RING-type domain-containing protein n=1 Tax=Panagrellus redivivus TaxID=6233 RepID=A0A7E5A1A8_PANRE